MAGSPVPSLTAPFAAAGTVVLGDGQPPSREVPWRGTFRMPQATGAAATLAEVRGVVEQADAAARAGQWAVLVLAYEAAPAFDPALVVRAAGHGPLAWVAVYDAPVPSPPAEPVDDPGGDPGRDVVWRPAMDGATFAERMAALHVHIAAGDTYQVNFTFPLEGQRDPAAAWHWYAAARRRAHVPYAAWIARAGDCLASLSPELFFLRQGTRLLTRPMKGTAARGRFVAEDLAAREALARSEKARAENVMIVDLLRNDLGRVARPGSVHVTDLCGVEQYPTVWQLTSTIEAEAAADLSLWRLLEALFPCGSVTGAPKVSTMRLIAAHEVAARGAYTGAIVLLRPGGDAIASVPIRTATLTRATGDLSLGVGAGITADSDAAAEYAECLLKAEAWRPAAVPTPAGLFETLRLEQGRWPRRPRHLGRLLASAAYFGWTTDAAALEAALDACAARHPAGVWRVRLTLHRDGTVACAATTHDDEPERIWRVGFATAPVSEADLRLFHKTLDRSPYDAARASRPALDDVLLCNSRGQVTESSIANVVVERDGVRWTPPVTCGLLPGTMRADLLDTGAIRERVLTRDDVRTATGIWLINALRGWMPAKLEDG